MALVERAARQHELRAVEPDALRAVLAQQLEIFEQLDVRLQPDCDAVGGGERRVLGARVAAAARAARRGRPRRRCASSMACGDGLDGDLAGRAVEDDRRAGGDPRRRVVQADDGRHLQRARQDRGVIRAAAGVDREALDARPVELRGQRRRELVGDEDRRAVELAQQIARAARAVPQVHAQPAGDVGDVVLALAQVLVLDAGEDVARALRRRDARPTPR